MKVSSLSAVLSAAFLIMLAGCDAMGPSDNVVSELGTVAYAHESNNRAELTGTQNGNEITGTAIVNYAKGAPSEWRTTVNLRGRLSAGTYDVFVLLGDANETLVCSFTLSGPGSRAGCSADTDLPGFNRVEVREASSEAVVAAGTFARRGGNRF